MKKILFTISFLLMSSLALAAGSFNANASGIALKGYDPVAYFTDGKAVKGSGEYQHEWMGVTWQFSSKENKDLFVKNPENYIPQYGGYCAYAVAKGSKADVDPNAFSFVGGKLYLNFNPSVKRVWEKNAITYIKVANAKWPQIK